MALVSKPSVIGNFEFAPNPSESNSGRGGRVGSYGSSSVANCKGLSLSFFFFNLTSLLLKVHLCMRPLEQKYRCIAQQFITYARNDIQRGLLCV